MGHGFCQWNLGLCMVLVACLVLCLGPGAETLKCKKCIGKNSEVCLKKAEDVDCGEGDGCAVEVRFYENKLFSVTMECRTKKNSCESTESVGKFIMKTKCCSDKDFCNNNLSTP